MTPSRLASIRWPYDVAGLPVGLLLLMAAALRAHELTTGAPGEVGSGGYWLFLVVEGEL